MKTIIYVLKNYLSVIFYIFIALLSLYTFYVGFNNFSYEGLSKLLFQSDYYINYKGGFVRRGLDGHIIYCLSEYFNQNTILVQKIYNLIFFVTFLFLISIFIYKTKPPFILLFSFSILLLYFIYITNDLRKDHIMIVYFFILIYFLKKNINIYKKIIIVNHIFFIGILSHELFYLIAIIPTIFIVTDFSCKKMKSSKYIITGMLFLPTILFLIISVFYKGTIETSETIIHSWKHMGVSKLEFSRGIFGETLYIWKKLNFYQILGLLFTLISHFIFMYVLLKKYFINPKRNTFFLISHYLICILLCTVAIDYSRWVFLFNITFLITIFSGNYTKNLNLQWFPPIKTYAMIMYLFIGMPYSRWTTKSWILSTPAGITLKLIRDNTTRN